MTDYDRTEIPSGYDRARDHGPEVLALWMNAVAAQVADQSITRILDLGCGTGRFTEGLAARFNAEVVGLDPSEKMLAVARAKQRDSRVQYQVGRAEKIPLPAESVDLVFMSMSYHHFGDPVAAARECHRVLTPDGIVFIRNGTRDRIPEYPYVPFIAASWPILERDLPSIDELRATFERAGLRMSSSQIIRQTIAPNWNAYAEKLEANGDSVLAKLSKHDFDEGIAAVKRYAETDGNKPVVEPIDVLIFQRTD